MGLNRTIPGLWIFGLAVCITLACSDDAPNPAKAATDAQVPPGDDDKHACAELEASCLENQQICVAKPKAHCERCPGAHYTSLETHACVALDGPAQKHEFADFTVQPNEEVLDLCQSWTLNNDQDLWVNAVELDQNTQSHHSNWLFVPSNQFEGPDGVWPCKDRGYTELQAAIAGGVLYAQSTQTVHEVQKFPEGVAVRIPARSRIIGDVHLLNVTDHVATGHVTLGLYTIAASAVKVKLAPFHLTYHKLDIPPKLTSRFFGECDIDKASRSVIDKPLSMQVYFILPHTHALGSRYFVEVLGGPHDGESIFDVRGLSGESRGRYYTTPIDMAGAKGFRFGCEFDNPRNQAVHWGFGDQEMCENLGFIASDLAFEATVSNVASAGMDGKIPTFTGDCSVVAFRYDHEKPGG